ncbi:radical SAM protein [Streptomyces canus]|uniref:radical SAM protein n=1 Tax=Streptomyces canus TaxID=58343 RepID=UPI0036941000
MHLSVPERHDSLSVVLKIPGETCNINCHYCYEKRKPYPGSSFLEPETLEKFLGAIGERPLSVMLHGGEPMLVGRERLRRLLAVLAGHHSPVSLSMQTNGVLLSDAWVDFFERNWPALDLGVSLDGDYEGNVHRVDYRGVPTFRKVIKALELLHRRGWECGVIVVVTRKLLGRSDEVVNEMLRHPAIRNVKLSPCLDYNVRSKEHRGVTGKQIRLLNPDDKGAPGWATTPTEYTQFVKECFDVYRRKDAYQRFLLEPLVSIVRAAGGRPTGFTHFDYRKDPFIVTLYPDGRIGTCDELSMPDALLGHVDDGKGLDELLAAAGCNPLFSRMKDLLSACEGCRVQDVCRGGSLPDRLRYEASESQIEYCNSRMDLIDAVSDMMNA